MIQELQHLATAELLREAAAGEADRDRLIHDLRVHQIELEMQNRELREAQERLEEARERYADLYDFAPVGYATLDPAGVILDINLTGARLIGAPRGELIGRPFASFAAVADRPALRDHLEARRGANRKTTGEVSLLRGKHAARTVQLISEPVADRSGQVIGLRTILIDISEVKQLDRQLHLLCSAGEVLAASLDRAATLDAAARVAVPAVADLCMIDLVEAAGIERAAVVLADPSRTALADRLRRPPPAVPGWQTPQAGAIASGEPMLLAEVPRLPSPAPASGAEDPHTAIRSMMVVPLVARDRTLGALTLAIIDSSRRYETSDLGLARDLANRIAQALDNARLYTEARRATASRDATLAVVSHDLRVPLNSIMMSSGLVMELVSGCELNSMVGTSLAIIQRSADRMSRLIHDLLDVSSLEAGTLSIVRRREPVGPLVGGAVDAMRTQAAACSLELALELPAGDRLAIHADRDRVLQVLDNLIGNAIKFSKAGGVITVRVERRGGELWFSVADRGPGIAPADLPHVFDRFWKAERTAHLGVGLGLAIAKGIVEAHGGRIWAESAPGAGCRMWFALPLAEEAPERAAGRAAVACDVTPG